MPIRYGNIFPINENKKVKVFCNRGTSGIDGSSSTAVGHCISNPDQIQLLIIGDMSFFYDRNAFWNNEHLANLRIVLLNNSGGGIFNMIPGPQKQPELQKLFLTNQKLSAVDLANEFNMHYQECYSHEELELGLESFFEKSDHPKIIEVHSVVSDNTRIFEAFKSLENYGK